MFAFLRRRCRDRIRPWSDGHTSPTTFEDLYNTIKTGQVWRSEVVGHRKDGSVYDAALTVAPLRAASDRISGFVGILRDSMCRKELEWLKDEFVSNVSYATRFLPLDNTPV